MRIQTAGKLLLMTIILVTLASFVSSEIKWRVPYGNINATWSMINGEPFDPFKTYVIKANEPVELVLEMSCNVGQCGDVLDVQNNAIADDNSPQQQPIFQSESGKCARMKAALPNQNKSVCTRKYIFSSNSAVPLIINISSEVFNSITDPPSVKSGPAKFQIKPLVNSEFIVDFNGPNMWTDPTWISVRNAGSPQASWNQGVIEDEAVWLNFLSSSYDNLTEDQHRFTHGSNVTINNITAGQYNVTIYYGSVNTAVDAATGTFGAINSYPISMLATSTLKTINITDVQVNGTFSIQFATLGTGSINGIVLTCTKNSSLANGFDSDCDGDPDKWYDRRCEEMNQSAWVELQTHNFGLPLSERLQKVYQDDLTDYEIELYSAPIGAPNLNPLIGDIDQNSYSYVSYVDELARTLRKQVSQIPNPKIIDTALNDPSLRRGTVVAPVFAIPANAPVMQKIILSPGRFWENNAGNYKLTYLACDPDPADKIRSDIDVCVYNFTKYNNGQYIYVDSDGEVAADSYRNATFNPAHWSYLCNVNSPGQWGPPDILPINECNNASYVVCSEDGLDYNLGATYHETGQTQLYCVNPDNNGWNWLNSTGINTLAQIEPTITEICDGGVDNNCNAWKQFARNNVTTSVDYTQANISGTIYTVNADADAFDSACFSNLRVNVVDNSNSPLSGVDVKVFISNSNSQDQSYASQSTPGSGSVLFSSIPATTYNVVVSKVGYTPSNQRFTLNYSTTKTINFKLTLGACNQDCTFGSTNLCEADCDGVAGCAFYNATYAQALDGILRATTYYVASMNKSIVACEGTPIDPLPPRKLESIECPSGTTLIVFERVVLYNGKPTMMKVPVCRK